MYAASLPVYMRPLEHVSDDHVVVYRRITVRPHGGPDFVAHSVMLVSLVRLQNGYMMLFRSLDKDRVRVVDGMADPAGETWWNVFSWYVYLWGSTGACPHFFGASTGT